MSVRFRWRAVSWWTSISLVVVGCLLTAALLAQRRQQARLAVERDRVNLRLPFGPYSPFALNPDLQCFPLPSYIQLVGEPIGKHGLSGLDPQPGPESVAGMKPGDQLYEYRQIGPPPKGVAAPTSSGGYLVMRGKCVVKVIASVS